MADAKQDRRDIGRRGETIAADFLRRRGYHIHETNFRCPQGELDIVASEGNTLVFVEVRSRRGTRFAPIEESVPLSKQRKVRQVATAYLQARYGLPQDNLVDKSTPKKRLSSRAESRAAPPLRPARVGDAPPCRIDVVVIVLKADGAVERIELIRDAVGE